MCNGEDSTKCGACSPRALWGSDEQRSRGSGGACEDTSSLMATSLTEMTTLLDGRELHRLTIRSESELRYAAPSSHVVYSAQQQQQQQSSKQRSHEQRAIHIPTAISKRDAGKQAERSAALTGRITAQGWLPLLPGCWEPTPPDRLTERCMQCNWEARTHTSSTVTSLHVAHSWLSLDACGMRGALCSQRPPQPSCSRQTPTARLLTARPTPLHGAACCDTRRSRLWS